MANRTVLEIAEQVALRIGVAVPAALYSATGRTERELGSCIQEAADRIMHAHDWQRLKAQKTCDGDGTTTEFALPDDFLRMPKDAQVWSTKWDAPLLQIDPEEDLRLAVREYDLVVGCWSIIGGNMRFRPALAADEDAYYLYISNEAIARQADGVRKARFTADFDTFLLDDRALELGAIWEWKHRKGLPYEEDMMSAEAALSRAIDRDKGARMVTQRSRHNLGGRTAYPWNVGV